MTLNLIPMFGVLTAIVFLGEHLTVWHVAGGITVISGIMLFPAEKHNHDHAARPAANPVNDRSSAPTS